MNEYLTAARVRDLQAEVDEVRRRLSDAAEVREGVRKRVEELEADRRKLLALCRGMIADVQFSNVSYLTDRIARVISDVEGKK